MDAEKEDTRLAELREALRRSPESPAKSRAFEISAGAADLGINLSDLHLDSMHDWSMSQISPLTTDQISTIDLSSLSINTLNTNGITTMPSGISPSWSFADDTIRTPGSGKLTLTGDDADIEINGESVVGMLRDIRDRLAILQVSEQMEAEWDELRALREQYEAKLTECQEKSRAWQALKNMPPPETK